MGLLKLHTEDRQRRTGEEGVKGKKNFWQPKGKKLTIRVTL